MILFKVFGTKDIG